MKNRRGEIIKRIVRKLTSKISRWFQVLIHESVRWTVMA